ncbi:protein FAR1-RELATED SEQUENCE 5-like [Arachis stenosperma]|uniref:protein FAR1-RELATED SEQUENCE 5-like n=1 Tax=Arachis stenosperma TaxID=217475 RepID=UPI0025AD355F|nr:protein FAR1-RELATED SEQUENCE 5-like [Arachis stenosperma]
MSGWPPPAIVTNQYSSMKAAIRKALPHTRHRWCLWHIMKKVREKFKGYGCYEHSQVTMGEVVHQCLTIENFEDNWNGFVNTYCLEDNEWLQGMWNNRRCWVPVYLKGDFGARISSTQRSESVHFLFDKYLNPQTTLGGRKNFDSMNKVVPCCSFNSETKVQFQFEYMNDIF